MTSEKIACQKCSCTEHIHGYRYIEPSQDWQLRPVIPSKTIPFFDTQKSKTVRESPDKLDGRNSTIGKQTTQKLKRSDSSSSEEITIKINLKKALEKAAKKKKKHKTINIYAQGDSDSESTPPVPVKQKLEPTAPLPEKQKLEPIHANLALLKIAKTAEVKKEEEKPPVPIEPIKTPPVEQSKPKDPTILPSPAVEVKPISPTISNDVSPTNTEHQSSPSGNIFNSLGLGVKVVSSSTPLTIVPKIVKTGSDLDPALNTIALALTNKNLNADMKTAALSKFAQDSKDKEFWKVSLTDKGRELQLAEIDSKLTVVRAAALKLYVTQTEKPSVVGGLYWDSKAEMSKLESESFVLKPLGFANADEEKEITKTLKNCLKAKQPEI